MKFFGEVGRGPRINRLDFAVERDQDQDAEIFCCPTRPISLSVEGVSTLYTCYKNFVDSRLAHIKLGNE